MYQIFFSYIDSQGRAIVSDLSLLKGPPVSLSFVSGLLLLCWKQLWTNLWLLMYF